MDNSVCNGSGPHDGVHHGDNPASLLDGVRTTGEHGTALINARATKRTTTVRWATVFGAAAVITFGGFMQANVAHADPVPPPVPGPDGTVPPGQPVIAPVDPALAAPAPPPVGPPTVPEMANPQFGSGSGPLGFLRDAWHQAQDPYNMGSDPAAGLPPGAPPPPGAGPAPALPPGFTSVNAPGSETAAPPQNYSGGPALPPGYYPIGGPPPPDYQWGVPPPPPPPDPNAYVPVVSPPPPPLIPPPE